MTTLAATLTLPENAAIETTAVLVAAAAATPTRPPTAITCTGGWPRKCQGAPARYHVRGTERYVCESCAESEQTAMIINPDYIVHLDPLPGEDRWQK